jgi:hypothetical protein
MKGHRWIKVGIVIAVMAGLLALPGTAGAVNTGFDTIPIGTFADDIALPGVDFISGLGVPGNWTVQAAGTDYVLLSGHVLKNADADCRAAIQMRFDDLQGSIGFVFGTDAAAPVILYLYTGGNPTPGIGTRVHTGSYAGADLGTGMLEGSVNVTVAFDYVVLYSPGACLAIDNLSTSPLYPVIGPDMIDLPTHAAVGTILYPTEALWAPMEGASTGIMLEPGKTLWVLGQDKSGEYFQVSLSGVILWVPVKDMGPNYDDVWHGQPLPNFVN